MEDMEPSSVKVSPFDVMAATRDPQGEELGHCTGQEAIVDNRGLLLMVLTTEVAVLIGCVAVLVWRRSSSQNSARATEPPRPMVAKTEPEPEIDDGLKKVTIFYGTQAGTAEGFAKALVDEAKSRYEKMKFRGVDLDDYAADDEEYEEKLKKESLAIFFLATYGDGEPTDNAARFYKWFTEGKERGMATQSCIWSVWPWQLAV